MDPNSLEYQKSIAREFNAVKDRVRHLIGSAHWGEDGRYKEIILINFLKRFLPTTVGIGTGFIKDGNRLSTQIDVIIFDPAIAGYFKESDFIIIHPSSVLGIIEVKSNPDKFELSKAIYKASKAGSIVNRPIFNGVFVFGETDDTENTASELLKYPQRSSQFKNSMIDSLHSLNGVNHIVSNDGAFIRKSPETNEIRSYAIFDVATSYFFSNLLEMININNKLSNITASLFDHLYPIEEGKEEYKKWTLKADGSSINHRR